jgi:cyanophycinase
MKAHSRYLPVALGLASIVAGARSGVAQVPEPWWPTVGTVVLSGGGLAATTNDTFVQKIIALAGGPDAQIVVIPTANPRADTTALRRVFEARGAHAVTIVHTLDHATANSPAFVQPLRAAKAVFITGGQPMILERAYLGTLVEREIKAVLARGGVLAGDSAGAISLGCAFLTWLPDPFGKRSDEFCALPHVAVSPHANMARGYVTDSEVLGYLRQHHGMVGIDIDQNTVLVLRGSEADVFGDGVASFVDPSRSSSSPWLTVRAGERVNVK